MINKTFRLFVSSTFADFIREREILNTVLAPQIAAHCQTRGYDFQLVDLRWGVNTESSLNQQTIPICLEEVNKCKTLSPKPNFLAMVGNRYGWTPLPYSVSSACFHAVWQDADDAGRQLLEKWYIQDLNDCDKRFFLQSRTGAYTDDAVWQEEENSLRTVLMHYYRNHAEHAEELKFLTMSATEQEIVEGFLKDAQGSDNVIVMFRESSEPALSEIAALKQRISDKLTQSGCAESLLTLTDEEQENYEKAFTEKIAALIIDRIDAEIDRLNEGGFEYINDLDNGSTDPDENAAVPQIITNLAQRPFVGREKELEQLKSYIFSNSNEVLFLTGDSGSGKSTLLAKLVEKTKNCRFAFSFFGTDDLSFTMTDALQSLCYRVDEWNENDTYTEITSSNITKDFYSCIFNNPFQALTVLILDGIDMYTDIDEIFEPVFPTHLPHNLKIIVSCADSEITERFLSENSPQIELGSLNAEESMQSFEAMLLESGRCLTQPQQQEQIRQALADGALPIKIRLLADICAFWKSHCRYDALPELIYDCAIQSINNMFLYRGHNRELVLNAMALIAQSEKGITENELQKILLRIPEIREYLASEPYFHFDESFEELPYVIWSRLFFDLERCMSLTIRDSDIVVQFIHAVFKAALIQEYPDYLQKAGAYLTDYFEKLENYADDRQDIPNRRKIKCLPALYRNTGHDTDLLRLYEDDSFIDASVKCRQIDKVLSDIQLLLLRTQAPPRLRDIYYCLNKNRTMLSCYYDGFYICAYHFGIQGIAQPLIEIAESEYTLEGCPRYDTVYNENATLIWAQEFERYAVVNNRYISIYDSANHDLLCKIFIETGHTIRENTFCWIDRHTVAFQNAYNSVCVYSFEDLIPNIVFSVKRSSAVSVKAIRYFSAVRCLTLILDTDLETYRFSKDKSSWEKLYAKKLQSSMSPYILAPYADKKDNQLYYLKNNKTLIRLDVQTGEQTVIFKINKSVHRLNSFDSISVFDDTCVCHAGEEKITMLCKAKKKPQLLTAPLLKECEGSLLGHKVLLFFYPAAILKVDLENENRMSCFPIRHYGCVNWIEKDKTVSILINAHMYKVSLDDFIPYEDSMSHCMVSRHDMAAWAMQKDRDLVQTFFEAVPELHFKNAFNRYEYAYYFKGRLDRNASAYSHIKSKDKIATAIVYSNDGWKAIAYEIDDSIIVYDENDSFVLELQQLRLSVLNNLLHMFFSVDSRYLILHRNATLEFYDLEKKECALRENIMQNTLVLLSFDPDTNTVQTTFRDNAVVCYKLTPNGIEKEGEIPFYSKSAWLNDDCIVLYTFDNDGTAACPRTRLNRIDMYLTAAELLKDEADYCGNTNIAYYLDGQFYLWGADFDSNMEVANAHCDFKKSRLLEQSKDNSDAHGYLREKNELLCAVLESDVYFIIISIKLNSVIVINKETCRIDAAYKIDNQIIGYKEVNQENEITLICNRYPYEVKVKVNI